MPYSRLLLLLAAFCIGCGGSSVKKHVDPFYDTTSVDWDLICLPVVKPYRANSVTNGRKWGINFVNGSNYAAVQRLGVSQNFIYGQASDVIIGGQKAKNWFAFDMSWKLFVAYDNWDDLSNFLTSAHVLIKPMKTCNDYLSAMVSGQDPYWYIGKGYPVFARLKAMEINEVNITEKGGKIVDFNVSEKVRAQKTGVYFFKINFNQKQNDLYSISIGNYYTSRLVKDGDVFPVFNDADTIDVTLYVSYLAAEEKKMSTKNLYSDTKSIKLISDNEKRVN